MVEEKLNISDSFRIIGGLDKEPVKKRNLDKSKLNKNETLIPLNENDVSDLDYITE